MRTTTTEAPPCAECGLTKPIVNQFYDLCTDCNFRRTHHGQTRAQVGATRLRRRRARPTPSKTPLVRARPRPVVRNSRSAKRKAIPQRSAKQVARDAGMRATYAVIDATREPVCEGCGRGDCPLSHSHVLSQGQRKDLVAEAGNIRLHCPTCHDHWEGADPLHLVHMRDIVPNLTYVVTHDRRRGAYLRDRFARSGVPWPLGELEI